MPAGRLAASAALPLASPEVPDVADVVPVPDPIAAADDDVHLDDDAAWPTGGAGSWRDRVDAVAERVAGPDRRWGRLVAAAVLGLGVLVAVLALLRPPPATVPDDTLPFTTGVVPGGGASAPGEVGATTATTAPTVDDAPLVVHGAGAVVLEGLYELTPGSRVADLLAAAGGPTPDADLDRLNLAAPLVDGQRVWFPRVGEDAPPTVVAPEGGGSPGPGATAGSGAPVVPVNVNTASAVELEALPGVGPATAAAIVEHRERTGPFVVVEDLLAVNGIGDAKLAQMRDQVAL